MTEKESSEKIDELLNSSIDMFSKAAGLVDKNPAKLAFFAEKAIASYATFLAPFIRGNRAESFDESMLRVIDALCDGTKERLIDMAKNPTDSYKNIERSYKQAKSLIK